MDEPTFSEYGKASREPSPVNRMMASFAADFRVGTDVNLGVGYVNEHSIPGQEISQALSEILRLPDRYCLPFNYGGPKGSTNLTNSLRTFLTRNPAGGLPEDLLNRNEIVIGPSGATSLLEGIGRVMQKGIVVTTDPMYYIYCEYLQRVGFELMAVPEDEEGIRLDQLEERVARLKDRAESIRFVYVVTVNNPSCTILSNERRKDLVQWVARLSERLGRKIPLILDRAYEDLIHDPAVPVPQSALAHDEAGLVYEIGTLSKVLAPALRIGYMVGPRGPLVDAMVQKTSDTGFSAPLMNQEISAYMLDHHIGEQIQRVNAGYREKALSVRRWIDDHLGPWLSEYRGGRGGFYYYLTFRDTETHPESPFFRHLSRTSGDNAVDGPPDNRNPRVLYLPGSFCVHPSGFMVKEGMRQLRLSYGFEEPDRIETGIRLMAEACEGARTLEPA